MDDKIIYSCYLNFVEYFDSTSSAAIIVLVKIFGELLKPHIPTLSHIFTTFSHIENRYSHYYSLYKKIKHDEYNLSVRVIRGLVGHPTILKI